MLCVPTARLLVLHAAVRLLPAPASPTAAHPLSATPPSVKLTLPVGAFPVTVAVNVTSAPTGAGFCELASTVDVCVTLPAADSTAAAASTMPAPHSAVVQSRPVPVGNARAVVWIFETTCAGV